MKSFRSLVEMDDVEVEEIEEIESIEDYEEIYEEIIEAITEMKMYAKELGLTNEQINPLVEALQSVDKVDDLIRGMFTTSSVVDDDEEENEEEDNSQW